MINCFFGGDLAAVEEHLGVRHALTSGRFPSTVNSHHKLGLGQLREGLAQAAMPEDGSIEAVSHETHPVMGVIWRPEREEHFPDRGWIEDFFQ